MLLLLAGVLLGATPAAAYDIPGPCEFHRLDGESIEDTSLRRQIVCAVERFGPVPGGADRAICIARRESGLDPDGDLFTDRRVPRAVPARSRHVAGPLRRYTQPVWELSRRALNGRTNAIVTIRMVADYGDLARGRLATRRSADAVRA